MSKKVISSCLKALGVDATAVSGLGSIEDEFKAVKKLYFKRVLVSHPDKGGDAAAFRALQEAWETLRDLYDKGRVHVEGFSYYFAGAGAHAEADAAPGAGADAEVPSWSWYSEAAASDAVPPYKCEAAKSDRSGCKSKAGAVGCAHDDPKIDKGEVRFGSMDSESGTYGRWHHLRCWRVPASIWMALPDPAASSKGRIEAVLQFMQQLAFIGFSELTSEQKGEVVDHFMDKAHWAKQTKNSKACVVGCRLCCHARPASDR